MSYRNMLADVVAFNAHGGIKGEAYYARPAGSGPFPGVVLIHHMPGWDQWSLEATRRLAHNGFATISPHLFFREGGAPDDAAARARAKGGSADEVVIGDVGGAMAFLRAQKEVNGKVGIIGFCSGGRHVWLATCQLEGVDAAVDCWGGRVIPVPEDITPTRRLSPIALTESMTAPLLGIFGNDDKNPDKVQVNKTEDVLKKLGKKYEFHRYDGCGHAFFNWSRTSHRPEQAEDAWQKVYAFYNKHLR